MKKEFFNANWNSGVPITNISHNILINKGLKTLFLDVDGTLLTRSETVVHKSVASWIEEAKKLFRIHLISNNPSKKRISSIAKDLRLTYSYRAGKPSRKELINTLNKLNAEKKEVAIIGDRVFTDVIAGNRLGIYTILVKPLGQNGVTKINSSVQTLEIKIGNIIGAIIK